MDPVDSTSLVSRLSGLTTPHLADACLRLGIAQRAAPSGIVPAFRTDGAPLFLAGRALPVRHRGSVDAFLEALDETRPGDVMVIDDGGRRDRGCIGDLVALEAHRAGNAAVVVWGAHRDTADLVRIGMPVFSLGSMPCGPTGIDPGEAPPPGPVRIGDALVGPGDVVVADDDGVIFIEAARLADVESAAREIAARERRQAELMREGRTLRSQLRFDDYLRRRHDDPSLTFRAHLRAIAGEIEA